MAMKVDHNLVVGIASSVWSALLGLLVVPIYLKYLGMEAYALIAFFTSAQALLQLLDMGLVPTMNREVARSSGTGNLSAARTLLHSLSIVYWITAFFIGLTIALVAPFISRHWLQGNSIGPQTISRVVMLMGVVIACRWPIGIYQGAIMGAQRLMVSSAINAIVITVGSLGTVALLALVSPRIEVFFIWQAVVGIAYAAVLRMFAWRIIGRLPKWAFDREALRRVWRFSAGMSGVAITGIILMQIDKLLLSRILSLQAFGAYALATALAAGLYILLTPTFNVIYPRLSAMVAADDLANIAIFYRVGTRFLTAILFPLAAFICVYSNEILLLWTRNPTIASNAAPILSIFIVGTALNGAMHFPYALQLAYGKTRLPLQINLMLLALTVPMTIMLASRYGAIGGALSWAVVNALYLLLGTWFTHRSLLVGIGFKWLVLDVGIPFVISALIVRGLGLPSHFLGSGEVASLAYGGVTCLIATLIIIYTSEQTKAMFTEMLRKQMGMPAF